MAPRDLVALSLNRMQWNLAALRLRVDVMRLQLKLVGYDGDQPRIPAGQPGGGRWTDGGGSEDAGGDARVTLVGDEVPRYSVSLEEDERKPGAHTLRNHVGKTDTELLGRLERMRLRILFYEIGEKRNGSFASLAEANDLVNQTLKLNAAEVDSVATGKEQKAFITNRFGYKTGREARVSGGVEPYVRDTYGVGVLIVRDAQSPRGYYVFTAYPRND